MNPSTPARRGGAQRLGAFALAALLAAGANLGARAQAAEPPPPAPAPEAKSGPPAPPAAKPADAARTTPQHFEPTEKTRADFEVSFPIDI